MLAHTRIYYSLQCLICLLVGGDGVYHFKILVPSIASGAIIGKGGETIAQLQKDTNTRVKMSKANDFYPGTLKSPNSLGANVLGLFLGLALRYVYEFVSNLKQLKISALKFFKSNLGNS